MVFNQVDGQRFPDALLFGGLLGASTASFAQQAPSAADLLANMRARFNAAPLKTQRLSEDVTMLSGPGGSVVVLNGPDGKFVVDTFGVHAGAHTYGCEPVKVTTQ